MRRTSGLLFAGLSSVGKYRDEVHLVYVGLLSVQRLLMNMLRLQYPSHTLYSYSVYFLDSMTGWFSFEN